MPDLEGRTMLMVLGPNPKRIKPVVAAVAEKKPDTPGLLSASDGQTEQA